MVSQFPQFQALSSNDRQLFEKESSNFPQYSDISFNTLMTWWNLDNKLKISKLNGNLVIYYSLPFDNDSSGLSIIGVNNIDESLDVLFKSNINDVDTSRLVHVPDFTVASIKDLTPYNINEELKVKNDG